MLYVLCRRGAVVSGWSRDDAFTWAHYLATSQGLVLHNRMEEGFALLNVCLEQYKSHIKTPDPFCWPATYKAILLLAHKSERLGQMFINYASELTSYLLPDTHPFNRVWPRIKMTGLAGLQQHAAAIFEAYLNMCSKHEGLLAKDQASLVQNALVEHP